MVVHCSATPVLSQRDGQVWTSNKDGTVKYLFSDEQVYLGSVSPHQIIHELSIKCNGDAEMCAEDDVTIDGVEQKGVFMSRAGSVAATLHVKMRATGNFDGWIHNALVDGLRDGLLKALDASKACDESKLSHLPQDGWEKPYGCTVPKFWGISIRDPATDKRHRMGVTIDVQTMASGFCKAFSDIGGAMASTFDGSDAGLSGIGGSFFGLICSAAFGDD
ncbi:Hypothetical protein D9617_22g065880 [Elsinoe fawcettii]|nr:Hypothetical protein D9617_22g065880 [Elsinoe fawcettii]